MVTKKILISFAKSGESFDGRRAEIVAAVNFANRNLISRHDVHITYIDEDDHNHGLVLTVLIPDDISDTFSVGNHLRGISQYLLKNYPKYKDLLVGKRLLSYTVLPEIKDVIEKEIVVNGDSIDVSKVPLGTNVNFDMAVIFKNDGEYHVSVHGENIIVTKED